MSDKNQQNFPHLPIILLVLVMVTAHLVIAGCLFPASEKTTAIPLPMPVSVLE
jgi:hypothetical protein